MVKSKTDARRAVAGGAFAGLTAGLILTLLMTVMSAAGGGDIWYGIKGAAAPFLGQRAMVPGFDMPAVALGLACHLAVSVLWAIAFSVIVHRMSRAMTMALGVAWGFVVWIGMYYVVLPMVGLGSMRHDAPVGRAIMFHLLFSIAMTLALMFYQRFVYGARKFRHRQHPDWMTGGT